MELSEAKKIVEENEDIFFEAICCDQDEFVSEFDDESTIKFVDDDDEHIVFSINDQFYQIEVSHDSWAGTTYGEIKDIIEVEPVQVTVTQYLPKKKKK